MENTLPGQKTGHNRRVFDNPQLHRHKEQKDTADDRQRLHRHDAAHITRLQ